VYLKVRSGVSRAGYKQAIIFNHIL
jgi:hypothetical protein